MQDNIFQKQEITVQMYSHVHFYLLFIHSGNMGYVFNTCPGTLRVQTKIRLSVFPQELRVQPPQNY